MSSLWWKVHLKVQWNQYISCLLLDQEKKVCLTVVTSSSIPMLVLSVNMYGRLETKCRLAVSFGRDLLINISKGKVGPIQKCFEILFPITFAMSFLKINPHPSFKKKAILTIHYHWFPFTGEFQTTPTPHLNDSTLPPSPSLSSP